MPKSHLKLAKPHAAKPHGKPRAKLSVVRPAKHLAVVERIAGDTLRAALVEAVAAHAKATKDLATAEAAVTACLNRINRADNTADDDLANAKIAAAQAMAEGRSSSAMAEARRRYQQGQDEAEVSRAALPALRTSPTPPGPHDRMGGVVNGIERFG